jgi:hypothetical protein
MMGLCQVAAVDNHDYFLEANPSPGYSIYERHLNDTPIFKLLIEFFEPKSYCQWMGSSCDKHVFCLKWSKRNIFRHLLKMYYKENRACYESSGRFYDE